MGGTEIAKPASVALPEEAANIPLDSVEFCELPAELLAPTEPSKTSKQPSQSIKSGKGIDLIIVTQQDCCAQRAGFSIISRHLSKSFPGIRLFWSVKPNLLGAFEIETVEGEKLWSALERGRMPLKGQADEVVGRYIERVRKVKMEGKGEMTTFQ